MTTPYTQQMSFGYSAHVRAGPVYPTGNLTTGDPIFLSLVHKIGVHIEYTFTTAAGHQIAGSEGVFLQLSGQSGWSRRIVLVPPTQFHGDHSSTDVMLDLPQLESLLAKVGSLTGIPNDAGYTIAVIPRVRIAGTVAGHSVAAQFDPAASFQLAPAQLVPEGATNTASMSTAALSTGPPSSGRPSITATATGSVGTATKAPNTLSLLGLTVEVALVRWLALSGVLVSGGIALYAFLRRRAEPFQETAHIQSRYGDMIVPIVAGEDLGWPAVDVPTIKALVKLADSGQRLILHSSAPNVDTYMVNDEGTVYRYQVRPSKVVWGDWSKAQEPPLEQAA